MCFLDLQCKSFSMFLHTTSFTQYESSHWFLLPVPLLQTGYPALTHLLSLCPASCSLLASSQVSVQPVSACSLDKSWSQGGVSCVFPPASFIAHRTGREYKRSFILLVLAGLKPFITDVSSASLRSPLEGDIPLLPEAVDPRAQPASLLEKLI